MGNHLTTGTFTMQQELASFQYIKSRFPTLETKNGTVRYYAAIFLLSTLETPRGLAMSPLGDRRYCTPK